MRVSSPLLTPWAWLAAVTIATCGALVAIAARVGNASTGDIAAVCAGAGAVVVGCLSVVHSRLSGDHGTWVGFALAAYGLAAYPLHRATTSIGPALILFAGASCACAVALRTRRFVTVIATAGVAASAAFGAATHAPAAPLLALGAFAVCAAWLLQALDTTCASLRRQALAWVVETRTADARHDARHALDASLRHDVGSALMALGGGANVLAEHFDKLSIDERATAADVVSRGMDRLANLLSDGSYPLDRLVQAVVRHERRGGNPVTATVPSGSELTTRPEDVAVVLTTLLHSSLVADPAIAGVRDADAMVLTVGSSDLVGVGGVASPLDVLEWGDAAVDLTSAARLMTSIGGDVRAIAHRDGRMSFEMRVPVKEMRSGGVNNMQVLVKGAPGA